MTRLLTIFIFFIFIIQGNATLQKVDTIPTPESIAKIKGIVYKIFHKKEQEKAVPKISLVENDTIKNLLAKSANSNYWTLKNKPGLLLTQTSFVNWSKGGNNSIAGIASFGGDYKYKKGRFLWSNTTNIKYGLSKEEEKSHTLKTDDILDIKSTFSYKTNIESRWYYSGEFNLTTQFAKGYSGNDRDNFISKFFSPARMRIGAGGLYTDADNHFKLHISPLTNQVTFVMDQTLANQGSYGVKAAVEDDEGNVITEGENIYSEFGTLIKIEYKTTVMKNMNLNIKSSFYSDYLIKFGNVDTDIELNLDMKVNEYIKANINSHLLYDDDYVVTEADGPQIQLKQILGVGINYVF